jgi:hypothetical protein
MKAIPDFDPESEFSISCGAPHLVFDVVEVLEGRFEAKQVMVSVPFGTDFLDTPALGAERIVVGKTLPEERIAFAGDNVTPPFLIKHLGALAPPEMQLLYLFGTPERWLFAGPAIVLGIGLAVWVLRKLTRRRRPA